MAAKSNPDLSVTIAMVGKYVNLRDSYISLSEALMHAGLRTRTRVNLNFIESQDLERHGTDQLDGVDAILVPGGFGERGIEGKIEAVRHARSTASRTSASASECSSRSSSTHATSPVSRGPTAPSSTAVVRTR